MIKTKPKIVKERRAKRVAPVHNRVVDRGVWETGTDQSKRVDRGIVLLGVRISAREMVFRRRIEINFNVILVIVEKLCLRVAGIILQTSTGGLRVQRRIK